MCYMFISRLHIHPGVNSSVDYIVLCCTKLCPLYIYLCITYSVVDHMFCCTKLCPLHIYLCISYSMVDYIFHLLAQFCRLHVHLQVYQVHAHGQICEKTKVNLIIKATGSMA